MTFIFDQEAWSESLQILNKLCRKIQALLGQKDRKYTGMIWINDVKQTDWTLKAPAERGPNSAVYNILVSPFYSQFTIEDL